MLALSCVVLAHFQQIVLDPDHEPFRVSNQHCDVRVLPIEIRVIVSIKPPILFRPKDLRELGFQQTRVNEVESKQSAHSRVRLSNHVLREGCTRRVQYCVVASRHRIWKEVRIQ